MLLLLLAGCFDEPALKMAPTDCNGQPVYTEPSAYGRVAKAAEWLESRGVDVGDVVRWDGDIRMAPPGVIVMTSSELVDMAGLTAEAVTINLSDRDCRIILRGEVVGWPTVAHELIHSKGYDDDPTKVWHIVNPWRELRGVNPSVRGIR